MQNKFTEPIYDFEYYVFFGKAGKKHISKHLGHYDNLSDINHSTLA